MSNYVNCCLLVIGVSSEYVQVFCVVFVLDHPFIFIHIFTLCCELYSSLQFLIAQVWFGEGSSISFFPLYLSCLELLSFLRVGFLISLGKFSVISLQTLHLCPILLQNLSTYIMLELLTVSQSVFHIFFFTFLLYMLYFGYSKYLSHSFPF